MMQLLKTHQISSGVIDIIEESQEFCYLVTPYLKTWPLLERTFARAAEQKKRITFVVRTNTERGRGAAERDRLLSRLNEEYGFEIVEIDFLHTKLYLNERRAILSSMNLYDSSQVRNFELAVEFTSHAEVQRLKQEVIDAELLALAPVRHRLGHFHAEAQAKQREMLDIETRFTSRGYCVDCGEKIELDRRKLTQPYFVRCRPCWAKDSDASYAPWERQIRHCHYCGDPLESVMAQPYHHACHESLTRYATWRKVNGPSPGRA